MLIGYDGNRFWNPHGVALRSYSPKSLLPFTRYSTMYDKENSMKLWNSARQTMKNGEQQVWLVGCNGVGRL